MSNIVQTNKTKHDHQLLIKKQTNMTHIQCNIL